MKCAICNNDTILPLTHLYDDRYGYPGIFSVVKCNTCDHKSLKANFNMDQIKTLYTNYYPRSSFKLDQFQPFQEIKWFRSWLEGSHSFAFRWVPKSVRVLDIGCGYGETLGYHQSRDCDVYGVEVDENIRPVAEKFGYKIHIGLFDPNNYPPGFFDYVTMDQVIEHLSNPAETLRGINNILKPGGVLILGTPNSNGWGAYFFRNFWINWHTPYHLQLFSVNSMRLLAEETGMALEWVKTITNSDWLFFQWIHLLTRPKMGRRSAFWNKNTKKNIAHKTIITLMRLFHGLKINHVITRFFDALGLGDNYIFFLRKNQ